MTEARRLPSSRRSASSVLAPRTATSTVYALRVSGARRGCLGELYRPRRARPYMCTYGTYTPSLVCARCTVRAQTDTHPPSTHTVKHRISCHVHRTRTILRYSCHLYKRPTRVRLYSPAILYDKRHASESTPIHAFSGVCALASHRPSSAPVCLSFHLWSVSSP